MKNKDIKLSIIIPVYNVEEYINDCLASLYCQGFDENEFEIIIVNDGSTDNSMNVAQSIIGKHNNIIVINQPNQGQAAARNKGVEQAHGEYIFFMDSDDVLVTNSLKPLLLQLIESGADTIQGNFVQVEDNKIHEKETIPNNNCDKVVIMSGKQRFVNDSAYLFAVWQNIYKKEFLISSDIKFIEGIFIEDVAYYSEMMIKAKTYTISSITHYIYRLRQGSTMATMDKMKLIHMNIANEYVWKNCKDIAAEDEACYQALVNRIFHSGISKSLWFVTHYRNIYPQWKEILDDFKLRIPLNIFNITWKQRATVICLKYFPGLFLWVRYKLNKKKYG